MLDHVASKNEELNREGDKKASATDDGVIPCVTWDLAIDPVRLPEIPRLPNLGNSDDEVEETRLVQIAGLDRHIVGLTNHGHVLKISLEDESTAAHSNWEYVGLILLLALGISILIPLS
jgi:SCF-associated factor 1